MIPRRIIPILVAVVLTGAAGYAFYKRNLPDSAAGHLLRDHPAYYTPWRFCLLDAEERDQALSDFQAAVDAEKPGIVSEALETIRTGSPAACRRAQLVLTRAGALTDGQIRTLRTSSNPAVWGYAALRGPSEPPLPRRIEAAPVPGMSADTVDDVANELKQRLFFMEFDEPERLQSLDAMDLDGDGEVEIVARTYSMGANWQTSRIHVFARHTMDSPVRLESRDPAGRIRFLQKTPGGPILVATASFICPIGFANTAERRAGQPGLRWSLQRWTGRSFASVGQALTPFRESAL